MAAKTYLVLKRYVAWNEPLEDGTGKTQFRKAYQGSTLELSEEQAAPMLRRGSIRPVDLKGSEPRLAERPKQEKAARGTAAKPMGGARAGAPAEVAALPPSLAELQALKLPALLKLSQDAGLTPVAGERKAELAKRLQAAGVHPPQEG